MTESTRRNLTRWAVALLAAALMSVVGVEAWRLAWPTSKFKPFELVTASCITWAILAPRIYKRSMLEVILIGLISPVVGSIAASTEGVLKVGLHSKSLTVLANMVMWSLLFIWKTVWITLPVGVITALLMRWIWNRWPPNQKLEHCGAT